MEVEVGGGGGTVNDKLIGGICRTGTPVLMWRPDGEGRYAG